MYHPQTAQNQLAFTQTLPLHSPIQQTQQDFYASQKNYSPLQHTQQQSQIMNTQKINYPQEYQNRLPVFSQTQLYKSPPQPLNQTSRASISRSPQPHQFQQPYYKQQSYTQQNFPHQYPQLHQPQQDFYSLRQQQPQQQQFQLQQQQLQQQQQKISNRNCANQSSMPPPHQHYRHELQGPPIPVQNQCYDFRVNQTPTTDLYDPQFVDRYYKPSTIYKYGDYYQESHDNLARYPISRHQEPNIVSVDINNGLGENENLDEHFRAYKDSLHNNIYTYMQMIDNTVQCFKEQILCERELEELKKQLWEQKEFQVEKLFKLFTNDEKFLTLNEFFEGIEGVIGLKDIKQSDVELLLKRFSKYYQDQNKITFEEFKNIFRITTLPQRRVGQDQEELSEYSINILKRYFKMLLNCESSFEYTRQKLKKKLCNFTYVFDYIDKRLRGNLSEIDFRNLLQNVGDDFYVNQRDIEKILNRFDKNQDGVVDLSEFILEFQPKSKARYVEDEY